MRHVDAIDEMQQACYGCGLGQPFDGHGHTETGDLTSMMCLAQPTRDRIDKEMGEGKMLRQHGWGCDCDLCLEDPNLWKIGKP
jgi:hypothetical protein